MEEKENRISYCTYCGTPLVKDANFCTKCGYAAGLINKANASAKQNKANQSTQTGLCKESGVVEKPKNKKPVVWLVVFIVFYVAWLALGIACLMDPMAGIAWGPYEDADYTFAMNYVTGFYALLLFPSFGYYLALKAPFKMPFKARIGIFVSCIAVSVIGDIVFYIMCASYIAQVKTAMKIGVVLAQAALIFIYLLGIMKIKPKERKGLIKFLVNHRNSTALTFVSTILCTLCTFALLEGLYALLAFFAVGYLFMLIFCILSAGVNNNASHAVYTIYDGGFELTLQYETYNCVTGADVYKDQNNYRWETKDNGRTFYKA